MRNKRNLLVSWMIGLLSFMFILNSSAFAANSYLEPVDIPVYNASDSTHVLITPTNGNWKESVINNVSYRHFYITPGKYTKYADRDTAVQLRVSGTEGNNRTLSLYNPAKPTDNTHPGALPDNEQANIFFGFDGASYWTLDRISNLDRTTAVAMTLYNNSHNNIINRWHGRQFKYGITIRPFCDYNTVQNSYVNGAAIVAGYDSVGLAISNNRVVNAVTRGTKFINNDIRNVTDGIQLVVSSGITDGTISYPDTIIDSNRIWVDEDLHTDGNGNYTPDGEYTAVEQGIDLKTGSLEADHPVIITNNIIWGYRQGDLVLTDGLIGSPVAITDITYNTKFNNNILFDSQAGIMASNFYYEGSEFNNNIIYDIGRYNPPHPSYPDGRGPYGIYIGGSDQPSPHLVNFNNNSFIKIHKNKITDGGYSIILAGSAKKEFLRNNLFIDTLYVHGTTSNHTTSDNCYYNHDGATLKGTGDNINNINNTDASIAVMGDYTFEYEIFTNSPKSKTLIGVINTKDSPHYEKAGSSIAQAMLANLDGGHWIINAERKTLTKSK